MAGKPWKFGAVLENRGDKRTVEGRADATRPGVVLAVSLGIFLATRARDMSVGKEK